MIQTDETGHVEIATEECCYCGEPLDGENCNGMHIECNEEYYHEMLEWEAIVE